MLCHTQPKIYNNVQKYFHINIVLCVISVSSVSMRPNTSTMLRTFWLLYFHFIISKYFCLSNVYFCQRHLHSTVYLDTQHLRMNLSPGYGQAQCSTSTNEADGAEEACLCVVHL